MCSIRSLFSTYAPAFVFCAAVALIATPALARSTKVNTNWSGVVLKGSHAPLPVPPTPPPRARIDLRFLTGCMPFGVVEAIWAVVALRSWHIQKGPLG
jgi:hypothetical protein